MENEKIDQATRQLIRSSSRAYLATELNKENKKKMISDNKIYLPYVTFVMVAFDYDCSPLLLLSDLSEHTKNLKNNNIISLLFCEEQRNEEIFPKFNTTDRSENENYEDPMSRPRVTVVGQIEKVDLTHQKKRFLSRHPASKLYANFKDMGIYQVNFSGGHITGGFAKVKWFEKSELYFKNYTGFKEDEFEIMDHMNNQHQKTINLITKYLIPEINDDNNWKITGIDPEGFDLRFTDQLKRYTFKKPINDSNQLRKVFIKLHHEAVSRSKL